MGALLRSARQPSRAGLAQDALQQGHQHLTFQVAGELFAVVISAIKEIIEYRRPTGVPLMPSFMRGVINLRGRVVPVIDLSARFGRGQSETTRRSCFVIVEIRHEGRQHDIGLAVDAVNAVLEIADAEIEPPPDLGERLRCEFISGMGKLGDEFVIILDLDKILSAHELMLLEQMQDPPAPESGTRAAATVAVPTESTS